MYLARLRRHMAIAPVAVTLGLLLAAGPALAQPASGKTDSHSATPDDPALGVPAPPAEDSADAPAAEPDALWFYVKDGQKMGPVTTAVLRQMVIDGKVPTTYKVWRKGMAGWLPMRTLPEFADMSPPPTPGEADTPREHRRVLVKVDTGPQPKRIRKKSFIVPGAIIFSITWIAGITSAIFASEDDSERAIYDPVSGNTTYEDSPEATYSKIAWLPVVGPIAGYAGAGGDDNRVVMLMVLWSAAQATGLGLFIAGMVGKKNPNYKGDDEAGLTVGPLFGKVNGIGLTTRF